jgi:hypothetical protein
MLKSKNCHQSSLIVTLLVYFKVQTGAVVVVHDHMVVGFTTSYATSAYLHKSCAFD